MRKIHLLIMTIKKQFAKHNKKQNMKEPYANGSNNIGRKVGFTVVFTDIIRRRVLPEESSIQTAEMATIKVAFKKIHRREHRSWVIYTDSLIYKPNKRNIMCFLSQSYQKLEIIII